MAGRPSGSAVRQPVSLLLFRALLQLLPRHRRDRYSDEMRDVFHALAAERRASAGPLGVTVLLMSEVHGLLRFSMRERLARFGDWQPFGGGWHPLRELQWAWRGVRARGWRAVTIVLLLALALAGNAVVFAVADSVVFTPVPYPRAREIVEIHSVRQPGGSPDEFFSAALLDEWRKQTDLFASVQGYLTKNVFIVSDGRSEIVAAADITPGLIELLGIQPQFGRSFTPADVVHTEAIPALLSHRLAAALFGSPQNAVGQRVETTSQPLLVVGVMPESFAFPQTNHRIWRVMDPRGPLTRGFVGVMSIARVVPGVPAEHLALQMAQRGAGIGAAAGARPGYSASPSPFFLAARGGADRARTMVFVLLGGAICLLLTACANVASLELAAALQRARTSAVQVALGASRVALARVAVWEGSILMTGAAAGGAALAWAATRSLEAVLPVRLFSFTANVIDVDHRAVLFMLALAIAGWLLTALPSVLFAWRTSLSHLLKSDDRSSSPSRATALVRRGLTVVEVATAVVLVIGAAMYTRSYVALIGVDKGFDATNLVQIGFTIPVEYHAGPGEFPAFADDVVARVRAVPGVVAAVNATAPPAIGNSPFAGVGMSIDGQPPGDERFTIGDSPVAPEYFTVIGLPLRAGRYLTADDPPTSAVITERFARRFWPDADPIGRSFKRLVRGGKEPLPSYVVGVVADFRMSRPDAAPRTGEATFHYYTLRQPPPPPPPAPAGTPGPRRINPGGSWRFLNVTARLDSPARAEAVLHTARSVDRRLRVTVDSVDDKYAEMFSDVLVATRVTNAFGLLALVVAVVGIYGVMAYLVAARRREIGIRMALGAGATDVQRMVMASATRLVVIGTVVGLGAAVLLSRWSASQFFGVSTTDPTTYSAVVALMLGTALLATWQPARQAARTDPALTLKAD